MLTASKFARRFGLSRTALLYYESIGLIRPVRRTASGYRCYGDAEQRRMEQITLYRNAGLALEDIARILDEPDTDASRILERRLGEIEAEISRLRHHQNAILLLLQHRISHERIEAMTKDKFVEILKAAGLGEPEMLRFHAEFERSAPNDHQSFLEFLQIPQQEINAIRQHSRG